MKIFKVYASRASRCLCTTLLILIWEMTHTKQILTTFPKTITIFHKILKIFSALTIRYQMTFSKAPSFYQVLSSPSWLRSLKSIFSAFSEDQCPSSETETGHFRAYLGEMLCQRVLAALIGHETETTWLIFLILNEPSDVKVWGDWFWYLIFIGFCGCS